MKRPTKILFSGDKIASYVLLGRAKQMMLNLERFMDLSKLDQLTRTVYPYTGARIVCSRIFGAKTIIIHTPARGEEREPVELKECLCLPHLAFGIVQEVKPPNPPLLENYETLDEYQSAVLNHEAYLVGQADKGRFKYDVLICGGKEYYLVEDVYSPGWEIYELGQFVIVSIGQGLAPETGLPVYDCGRDCLLELPNFQELIIVPFNVPGYMKKWRRELIWP